MPTTKDDVQRFWGALHDSFHSEGGGDGLGRGDLLRSLDDLEDMFRLRCHMAVEEMPLRALEGLRVLEVGSGSGGHSALFARCGARVTAVADPVAPGVPPRPGHGLGLVHRHHEAGAGARRPGRTAVDRNRGAYAIEVSQPGLPATDVRAELGESTYVGTISLGG